MVPLVRVALFQYRTLIAGLLSAFVLLIASNVYAVAGMVTESGGEPIDLGIATDDFAALEAAVAAAERAGADVLVTLGGAGQKPSVREAIAAKGAGPWKEVRIAGEFEVPAAGLYQLYVTAAGELSIDVDGKPALTTTKVEAGEPFGVLVGLEAGWHDLAIRYAPSGAPDLTVLLGGDRVTAPLSGAGIRQHGK